MKRFLAELKRREVIKTLVAYVGLSWLILQVVEVFSSLIEIPPLLGPGILLFLTCCLPVVFYLAWHFDFTFDGIKRTKSLDEEENENLKPMGIGSWLGLFLVVSVCGYIGFSYFSSIQDEHLKEIAAQSQQIQADSIAVLPFEDRSPTQDQAYLAVGIAEEITSLLGRDQGFKVAASRSSQILAEKNLPPVDIGRRLDVKTILTGSVINQGSQIVVNVELMDTANGHVLWSDRFKRELKDIFSIQSEIGRAVVNLLQDKYIDAGGFESLSNTNSTDAYVMYLKGREQYRLQTTEGMKSAREFFEQAIALDPEYAQAYVGLADTLVLLAEGPTRFGILKVDIAATLAERNLEYALTRETIIPEAFAVRGYVAFMRGEFDTAIEFYDKAIDKNPSLAVAYMWKNNAAKSLGRFQESLDLLHKANELDPISRSIRANLGFEYSLRGDYERAKGYLTSLINDFPDYPKAYVNLADAAYLAGDLSESLSLWLEAYKRTPDDDYYKNGVIYSLLELGLAKQTRTFFPETEELYKGELLVAEGRFTEALTHYRFQVDTNPDDAWAKYDLALYEGTIGNRQESITLLMEIANLIPEDELFEMPYCSPAIDIAWATLYLNPEAVAAKEKIKKCSQLLKASRTVFVDNHLDYLEARIAALTNNSRQFIESFDKAINNGWLQWWTEHDPLIRDTVASNAAANTLLKKHNQKLEQEKQKAAQIDISRYIN